ncbi:polyhydroxybutyrate depolymerase [Catalinimonas alkaloidigena]|uniref:Polyhydroxybutyrate depolymerase n=1 Tax=Catalinimonas alkaloidigena TaxID=1075417 RepID=A0A1G9KRF9_9BACT|nr:PHB depolymerase family esterase [Catalinimonas alkaloidigena]SDL52083.1 polyhydroxybutyrate depolymerase [Catalinimonas alkaloidigena]
MIRYTSFLTLCCCFFFNCPTFAQYDTLVHDGLERTYLVHLPPNYTETEAWPLVVAMHGGGGSAFNLQDQSGLSAKADAAGFVVVYPEGIRGGALNIRTWNAGWCCGPASSGNVDDVGFLTALLDTLTARYALDTTRIYATGMSNGGFISYRLACERSDRIAAIAPVACSMSLEACTPGRPVPIIHFHSSQDGSVPYRGGVGDGLSNHYNAPQDSVLDAWAAANGCRPVADTLVDTDEYLLTQWTDCDCGVEIHRYLTHDGGHSWPGGNQTPIGDPPSHYLNATDLMWDFFQQYTLACAEPSGAGLSSEIRAVHLFPNPSADIVTVQGRQIVRVRLRDLAGQVLSSRFYRRVDRVEVDLRNRPAGVYVVEITSSDRSRDTRLVVKQ